MLGPKSSGILADVSKLAEMEAMFKVLPKRVLIEARCCQRRSSARLRVNGGIACFGLQWLSRRASFPSPPLTWKPQ
jgi:hypothetical protein